MTAEVVVMNRSGIALAADSALTLEMGDNTKVRDSAVKLFMLSKYRPVGVLVYQNSSLLGVPWETIIKMFRHTFGSQGCSTLVEYGEALIEYLDGNSSLFPSSLQDQYYLRTVKSEYKLIEKRARKELADRHIHQIHDDANNNRQDRECLEREIKEASESWHDTEDASYFSHVSVGEIIGRNSGRISDLIQEVFGSWSLEPEHRQMLLEIASDIISKDNLSDSIRSGLIVAGFGETEHFPSAWHIEVGGVFEDRLKVRMHSAVSVTEDNPSRILSFADTEMVDSFLEGISDRAIDHLRDALSLIQKMPEEVVNAVPGLNDEERVEIADLVRALCEAKSREFGATVIEGSIRRRTEIEAALHSLSLNELAHVAETLVSLSSFQKEMSLGHQTVGGPIDVAVISKGDGFIWIERKLYFRPELNEHFFQNYHREAS
ncbi:MAG: hypothetical protein OXG24_03625 [Gammaproteobacteria bacterium]|nr:hypothetical protein [Gammaproteobacteria bacterium]